jgi:hypothetical protein
MTETIEQFAARVTEQYRQMEAPLFDIIVVETRAFLAQHRQVVEVTADDLADICEADEFATWEDNAATLNARLRARAVPAPDMLVYQEGFRHGKAWMSDAASRPALDVEKVGMELAKSTMGSSGWDEYNMNLQSKAFAKVLRRHATDTGWVQVPTTQTAGELVVPEDGIWTMRFTLEFGPYYTDPMKYNAGYIVSDIYDAIRRIDTDAPTTWIERTPATTRAWTAESVPEGHILAELPQGSAEDGAVYCFHRLVHRDDVAKKLNTVGAVRIYAVKPQDGPR